MAENKTQANAGDVSQFLNDIEDAQKRQDCLAIADLMREVTGAEPQMWGDKIVGFGSTHYRYASGREGDWFIAGFSPRKQNLTLYLSYGHDQDTELMQKLGKHSTGKACLYIKRLSDVDQATLRELVRRTVERATQE
jgi:hypothetical protein